ncbi:glycoside hydrolase family 5 protein [Parvularcula sp. LCG005]|uniref:glycoside hydrolase family 5 protein n=1 Tax=Parvularcula sp. LCG005 TaxID=3078805 RepID=UPI002942237F|nr:glycoside hydrolase family 5 protein [Parvularcula sp. LCG005]WOI52656.1 glycoside hydrolase family 5 protein [Parvularcula sp. LCG005]
MYSKIRSTMMAAMAAFAVGATPAAATANAQETTTSLTATEIAEGMGKGFNLGQLFESEQYDHTFANARPKIDAYYERGFRNVRIPVTWTEELHGTTLADPNTGEVNFDNDRLPQLVAAVDYALSKPGMYVVINAHHEHQLKDDGNAAALTQLWTDISTIFADRDQYLIFEILNEPHRIDKSPMPAETLRDLSAKAYDAIRAISPERVIIIGGNQWMAAEEMAKVWPDLTGVGEGKDPYVMATFHHYSPWTFHGDHQGDLDDRWTAADMITPMETMQKWAEDVGGGMPVYIGEWGTGWQSVLPTMQCNNVRRWYQEFDHDAASSFNMPTAVWDDGGWFGIFSYQTRQFTNNLAECISGQCEWTGEKRINSACKAR